MQKRWLLIIMIGLMTTLLFGCNTNGAYPSKDITVIVPKSPGGGTDITTRGLVKYAEKYIDAKFVVENKPGGGGVTGMVEGANAEADGYTLTMTTVELAMLPHMDRSPVTYEDFAPIVSPIADPAALIVPADAPYDTLLDFMSYVKEHPGEVKVGNAGIGSIWHLAAVAIEDQFDVEFTHVPYDGGSAPAVAALVGGHIDAVTVSPGNALSQIEAGQLKVLAIMSDERSPLFPDVPTFKETGFDFYVRAWAALTAPAGTPQEVMDILTEAFMKAAQDPEFKEYMRNQGIEPVEIGPEQLGEMMKFDHEYYGSLLKEMEL